MLIAQMTDIHIGFDPDARPEELNRTRFRATLSRLSPHPTSPICWCCRAISPIMAHGIVSKS